MILPKFLYQFMANPHYCTIFENGQEILSLLKDRGGLAFRYPKISHSGTLTHLLDWHSHGNLKAWISIERVATPDFCQHLKTHLTMGPTLKYCILNGSLIVLLHKLAIVLKDFQTPADVL